jgi:integrase|tara:strand:+ start:175 stop:1386 length:1212 start_codon:yes stop_codon:yes gene_type:complete
MKITKAMKITKTVVDRMSYDKEPITKPERKETIYPADFRWDAHLSGFGVRVYPSGRRSFVITFRTETGTKRFFTIGEYGELTVDQARRLAQDKLGEVRHGRDPQAERQEKRKEMLFEELAERYMDHAKHHKRSWKDDEQRLRDHILPALGKRKLSEITLRQIQKIHTSVKDRLSPATANRVAALVNHIFTMAGKWSLIEINPAKGLTMFREPPPRDIVLTTDQCRTLIDACDADENAFAAALFKLAMFTGRRVGELLGAKWTDVDLDKSILTLPQTKAGERQFVYLNEPAAAVLRTLPHVDKNPYIIAGAAKGKPLNFYRRAWNRILERTDIKPFPPHGLRHNYASTLVAAGVPLETVGHLLGHKNTVTTRKYAHYRPDHLHRAAETFSDVIDFKVEKEKRNG